MKGLVAEIFQNEHPSFLHVTTMSRSPKGNYSCENIVFFVKKKLFQPSQSTNERTAVVRSLFCIQLASKLGLF